VLKARAALANWLARQPYFWKNDSKNTIAFLEYMHYD